MISLLVGLVMSPLQARYASLTGCGSQGVFSTSTTSVPGAMKLECRCRDCATQADPPYRLAC